MPGGSIEGAVVPCDGYGGIARNLIEWLATGFLTLLVFVLPPGTVLGSDPPPGGEERPDQNEGFPLGSGYISTLLIDNEMPLIGGKWHGDIFVDVPLNGEPDGAEITLRRAKLMYSRGFGGDWQLRLSANYNKGGGLELSNSYFVYSGWQRARLTIGIDDPPFSLESVSSSSGLTFMERGLAVEALSERRGGGVSFLRRTPKSILNGMLVLFNTNQDNLREKGQAIVLHYVHSPINVGGRDNIHLGGSFSYRINADEDYTQFRSRPEIGTVNTYYVDTGQINAADRVSRTSLEASRVAGRLSWQTELLAGKVHRIGAETVTFRGAYVFVSWFLSNDSRNYDPGDGTFGPVTPGAPLFKGGRGAFELAFRASYVDLTDKDVIGGKESNLSLGFNWYLNNKLRLMTNVIKVLDVDRPGSEYDGQDPLIFALRAQWLIN